MYNVGLFKHKINVYKYKNVINENGFSVKEKILIASLRCKVDQLNGKELYKLDRTNTITTKKFTCRYNKNIDNSCFITYKDQNYNIFYIDNKKEQNRFVEIFAESVDL